MERYSFDAEYVTRLKAGDPETQRHFVGYFNDLLVIKLRLRLASADAVEDARQETFLRVLVSVRQNGVERPERLGAFVNAVCNNILLEWFRSGKRMQPFDATDQLSDKSAGPESAVASNETRLRVRQVLDEMPGKDRRLLEEVFFEERDKNEVCRELQVDRTYLRVLLHRARKRFKAVLDASERSQAQAGQQR